MFRCQRWKTIFLSVEEERNRFEYRLENQSQWKYIGLWYHASMSSWRGSGKNDKYDSPLQVEKRPLKPRMQTKRETYRRRERTLR
jgi:hypothetical protein